MSTSKKIPFTPEKYAEMQNAVVELAKTREEVMERLVAAREMGDLSENGAYTYAKFELASIGRQLKRLNRLLDQGFPEIKDAKNVGKIGFGSTVTVKDTDTQAEFTWKVVSKHESNPTEGTIAYSSPIGKALFGKSNGQTVSVQTPRGQRTYEILSVA